MHDLTCSIGTDVAFLAAVCPMVVGSDLDPVRLLMARHNLTSPGLPARLVPADALTRSTRGLLGYADPARRDRTGRRITSVSTVPTVADLDAAHRAPTSGAAAAARDRLRRAGPAGGGRDRLAGRRRQGGRAVAGRAGHHRPPGDRPAVGEPPGAALRRRATS